MAGIFKAYDIRGIVGTALNEKTAYLIGRGLATEVFDSQSPIVVSRDMRTHSPELAQQLAQGLADGGCNVVDIGLAATPMNYWANNFYDAKGSVQVTASHNGPQYNGFKVSGEGGAPFDYATGLDKVEKYVEAHEREDELPAPVEDIGKIDVVNDSLKNYLDWMDTFVVEYSNSPKLKIGIDTANGMGGFFLTDFFARHPQLELVPLYFELDGNFPNHEADPLVEENLRDVQQLVRENGCDFGVAFDGDADRCMFVDENGQNISSDLITALIGGEMLINNQDGAILYDLRSSRVVPEYIAQNGGRAVRGRVGHSFMKRLLKKENARFGGELSGHYYFQDCFNTDSGLMAMIQILNLWRKSNQNIDTSSTRSSSQTTMSQTALSQTTMSQLVAPLRKYYATGEINFKVRDAKTTQAQIEDFYAKVDGAKLDHLDGLTVEFADWWFNLRSSNTEPLLRLNLEANSEAERERHLSQVRALIEGVS